MHIRNVIIPEGRYWLFGGKFGKALGGVYDGRASHDTIAKCADSIIDAGYQWWQIIDTETRKVAEHGGYVGDGVIHETLTPTEVRELLHDGLF